MTMRNKIAILVFALAMCSVAPHRAHAASDLRLAPDLSFTDDSSSNFPLAGNSIGDGAIASDRATIMFFGTAHFTTGAPFRPSRSSIVKAP
jgi:hypothetical protein